MLLRVDGTVAHELLVIFPCCVGILVNVLGKGDFAPGQGQRHLLRRLALGQTTRHTFSILHSRLEHVCLEPFPIVVDALHAGRQVAALLEGVGNVHGQGLGQLVVRLLQVRVAAFLDTLGRILDKRIDGREQLRCLEHGFRHLLGRGHVHRVAVRFQAGHLAAKRRVLIRPVAQECLDS